MHERFCLVQLGDSFVIGSRVCQYSVTRWHRQIGEGWYRFMVSTRPNGSWEIQVEKMGEKVGEWKEVHAWFGG